MSDKYDSRPDTMDHISKVREFLKLIIDNLSIRSAAHDQSKLQSPEVEIFDEFTPKLKNSVYMSQEYKSFLGEMEVALNHHYANNSHHPQFFQPIENEVTKEIEKEIQELETLRSCHFGDSSDEGSDILARTIQRLRKTLAEEQSSINGMSLLDVIEMLIDWKAATLRHATGDIAVSIETNQKRFGYTNQTKAFFINTIEELDLFNLPDIFEKE